MVWTDIHLLTVMFGLCNFGDYIFSVCFICVLYNDYILFLSCKYIYTYIKKSIYRRYYKKIVLLNISTSSVAYFLY